ncbi:MAG TPA: transcription antitermination factor NusB [Terriglobia bacterium]|nr:transcription antitermination factor NusB [Terriglobia bacterium]
MASRTKARELALQMLFQFDVGKHSVDHVISTFLKPRHPDAETEIFARGLFEGAANSVDSLDQLIKECATNWRIDRMAAVDRNILRLAVYELTHYPENPAAVVINESIELARRFSQDGSVEFVNGVLDAVRKNLPAPQP